MIGIIDVGSSSVRLLVAQIREDGSMRVVAQDRSMTRLGDGLAANGRLEKKAAEKSVEAIEAMATRAKREGARDVRAFATAAVREATNGAEFVEAVRERTGIAVEVLGADEEARLAYLAVASAVDLSGKDAVVFDLGGGSLQVVHARRGVIVSNESMKLGAVRMHRTFAGPKGLTEARSRALRRHASTTMAKCLAEGLPRPGVVVGVGGTLTTLLAMAEGARESGSVVSSSGEVGIEELRGLIKLVQDTPIGDRTQMPGLPTDRADVILPGLIVVERLLTRLGAESVLVSEVGLREGLVLRTLRERERDGEAGRASVSTVRQFAIGCGYDAAHGEHVARLALSLFDQFVGLPEAVAKGFGEREVERRLLEAAAVAHDVGIMVEYRAHHKHTYTMISNADLPGWSREDQELVAVIGRYHRKAQPSKRHVEFARLEKGRRGVVVRLAAILRVADGLDRSHTQQVRHVEVTLHGKRLLVAVDSATDSREDVKGSRVKAGMLEEVLGCSVRYAKWQAGSGADAAEVEPPAKTPRPRRRAIRAR